MSSKVFWGGEKPTQRGLSKKHVHDACHAALKRLQVDYLDLYFCHRPDPETPVHETVFAMNDLIAQGKVLYWGTSEWKPNQLIEAYKVASKYGLRGPAMEQPEYNLFNRKNVERDLKPVMDKYGLGTTTWSPLCSGMLTGKYQDGIPKGSRFDLEGYEWLKDRYHSDLGPNSDSTSDKDGEGGCRFGLYVVTSGHCLVFEKYRCIDGDSRGLNHGSAHRELGQFGCG